MPSDHRARVVARLAADIESNGYAIVPDFLPAGTVSALRARAEALDAAGELRAAGIGRSGQRSVDAAQRGDRIRWLDADPTDAAERAAHSALEDVRRAVNRHLALGLFDVEAHYAVYPPGARYAPHRDRFRDDDARVLSCVLYLNEAWHALEGGALRLQLDHASTLEVAPDGGTLVTFLSARFVHEVLPATRARYSLSGWFRRRSASGC